MARLCRLRIWLTNPCGKGWLEWAEDYSSIHGVAHWDETRRTITRITNKLLRMPLSKANNCSPTKVSNWRPAGGVFPAVIWEDQDECLQVRPEDIIT